MLSVIVFSKHRPLQLQAYLESLLYYSDLEERSIYVLYKETGGISYWELIKKYPKVNWIEETNFLSDLKNIFKYVKPYVLWGCDDVFYKSICDFKICIKALSEKPEIFGFSLRLGRNIQPYPELINQKDFLMWDWTQVELPHQSYEAGISDWAYPWEVSGSIYRKSDISEFLKLSNQPVNPNYLESNVADYCTRTKSSQKRKYLACFEQSKCLTLTINRVQETHKNAFWTTKKTDVDSLFRFFQSGYRLNWKKYHNCQNPSVHVGSDYFELESEKLEGKSVPKISVIIPCYNQGRYLYEALESVVKQTYQNFEVIIVNDGSTDNTQEVAEEFIRIHPQYQIKLIAQANSGQPAIPRNRGISEAKGEYILPLDADDLIDPTMLEECLNLLETNTSVAIAYSDRQDFGESTQLIYAGNYDFSKLIYANHISYCTLYRKTVWENIGGYRTNVKGCEDWDFWIAAGVRGYFGYRIPKPLFKYRNNHTGLYQEVLRNYKKIFAKIIINNREAYKQEEISAAELLGDEISTQGLEANLAITSTVSLADTAVNSDLNGVKSPLISVIIPCYNHATLLREAVESVVRQTYPNWECIIVNDGSTDDTSNLGKYLIKLYPQKSLRLIDKPNTGPADSRNVGVQQSSGKFILFLDADDKLHPKFLEECLEILLAKPKVGFVYTDVQHFGANCDLVVHGDFDANRFLRENQAPATSLFRREIYEQVGGLKKVMKLGCEDWEFWVSAYEKGWLGDRLPKPYLYYRQHGDGSSRTQKMAGERPKLDLMRATIIHLHSQLYKPEEVRWSHQILQQNGNLIANELVEFNKPEQFLTLLSQYVGEYQKDQANEVNLANLRQSRQQLANYWLNLPAEQLANAYGGDAGKAHQLLLNSNIKDEALTDAEKTVIDRLAAHLSQGVKNPKDINYLLAAALYRRADQLLLNYENAVIPNWFVNDYLKFMFAAPTLFQEIGEADNYCRYVQGWVSYLHSNIFKNQNSQVWQDIAWFFTQSANFIPLYFNSENLKDIYTKRADIIEYAMKNRGAAIDCIFPARPANRPKIRLGVLTKHFGAMTETFATLPAFEYLNREQFEIILYALNLDGNKLEKYCQSRADRLVKLSNDLPTQVQTIRADDLDILLIATNITAVTHPISLLALHRLARVQTTCFNSPITTGMRHIDYYIAGKLMEPAPEGQEHYREQLATIDGPGCCFSYTLEPYTPNVNFTRNSIGISEESVVFISSANLYKLVPELRETWAKIMAAVPNSVLFLMPFGPSWTNHYPGGAFVNNMKAVFAKYGIESNRLRVLKSFPNRADVKEVLKLGDVYLDSYPYAGTTSLVDPLEVGLPTVVRDGDTLRSRMGAAVVRSLSMPDLIANSEASYIQLAVTLGTNPELRQRYRQEIQQKMQANPACFDSVAYSGAIGKLFQELFGNWQSSHLEASHNLQDSIPKQPDFDEILSNTVNLYQRNSSNISAISELRQIRKQIADFWVNIPTKNLETAYKSASGNSYKILLKSGFQRQAMIESEQMFLQQLTQISKGLVHPKAVNALLAAMLYFPPGTMRIPDARNRLPHWLIGDYEQVFETEAAAKSDSTSDLLAQYIQSPQFGNQLLGCVNLYRIDPSDESVVLELRQIRKQMADFWLTVPSEKLESFYRGEVRKGYQAILSCGLQAESMTEAEQQFLQRLTEISKGLVQPQAINALLGAMLYFVPGKMRVPDARTRLPQWLLEDYEKVFESAFTTTEQPLVKQDYLPQFLNQLTAGVNLYEIDPTAELVIADLRHIRKQIADLWLSVSGEQVEVLYRSDFGKGYKAMLGSGFIKEPLNESDREFFNSLVVELSKGFGAPKAVNNLLAAMLYCRPGLLRVQDANTCLPEWLLADYEQFVGGAVKVAVG
ncbi:MULTISPECIES: glycosyltransferase [unclassified Microcoleus]|uniref:glycosyltransferase n=1 Tax=unclassified Microcoleus TaxID=2642155 RepID=UPI002FD20D23